MSPRGGAGCVFRLCVIVAVILECNNATGLEVATVIGILKTGPLIIQEILDMWDELALDNAGGVAIPFLRDKERDVMEWIGQVSRQLDGLEQKQAVTLVTVQTLQRNLKALPNIIRLGRNLDTLEDLMNQVDSAYTELNRYIKRGYSNETQDAKWLVERQTLEDLASAVVSHSSSSIRGILERIHSILAPQQRKRSQLQRPGIFSQLAEGMHSFVIDALGQQAPADIGAIALITDWQKLVPFPSLLIAVMKSAVTFKLWLPDLRRLRELTEYEF